MSTPRPFIVRPQLLGCTVTLLDSPWDPRSADLNFGSNEKALAFVGDYLKDPESTMLEVLEASPYGEAFASPAQKVALSERATKAIAKVAHAACKVAVDAVSGPTTVADCMRANIAAAFDAMRAEERASRHPNKAKRVRKAKAKK